MSSNKRSSSFTKLPPLKEMKGKAPWNVLNCPEDDRIAEKYVMDSKIPWLLRLECSCGAKWCVCTLCPKQNNPMIENRQLTRHKRQHPKTDIPTSISSNSTQTVNEPRKTSAETVEIDKTFFARPASIKYFQLSQKQDATRFLVSQAVLNDTFVSEALEEEDVNTFMDIAQFVCTLSRTQRENFAKVVDKICDTHLRHNTKKHYSDLPFSKRFKETPSIIPVPRTKQELRCRIKEGKTSLLFNLPHPMVHTLGSHSYLLPSECIADVMAHGVIDCPAASSDNLHSVESLACCPLAREITERNSAKGIKTIIVSRWSDDFEPNKLKDNRGSIWISTLTIQTASSGTPGLSHVYPLVVGGKKDDHEPIERLLQNDLRNLDCTRNDEKLPVKMYNGRTKQNELVSVHLICVTQDQPERRGANGLLGGGSTNHARYGYAIDLSQFIASLPACSRCEKDMLDTIGDDVWTPRRCNDCHNWMADDTAILEFAPAAKFPESELPPGGKLKSMKIRFEDLLQAKSNAHDAYYSMRWNKEQTHEYLKYYCMNLETRNNIIKCAHKCNILKKWERAGNEIELAKIRQDIAKHPNDYREWESMTSWNGWMDLHQSHEAYMHLLFLGLAKYMILDLNDWAALRGKYRSLSRSLRLVTKKIERFHLSWCKVFPFIGDRLGGWVSENYLGFTRILPWAYSCVVVLQDDPPYVAPTKNLCSWTVDECKDWLRSRGLGLSGKVQVLRDRVNDNIDMAIGSNEIVSEDAVRKLLLSFWVLICHLMGMTTVNPHTTNVTSRLIRIYLNHLNHYDEGFRNAKKREDPMWLSAYNHICLLNVPNQIDTLGPIRNRWEGGLRGEGFIRKVKPMTTGVGRKNWTRNLLTNLLHQRTLLQMRKDEEEEVVLDANDDMDEKPEYDWSSFLKYSSRDLIFAHLEKRKPLSCLIHQMNQENIVQIYCCFKDRAGEKMAASVQLVGPPIYHFGCFYYRFHLDDDEANDLLLDNFKLEAYGLLLPLHSLAVRDKVDPAVHGPNAKDENWYTLVDSKWRALSGKTDLVFPHTYINSEYSD